MFTYPDHAAWTQVVGQHCSVCGSTLFTRSGFCQFCNAGLACRADTTCLVSPDPPCAAYRYWNQR